MRSLTLNPPQISSIDKPSFWLNHISAQAETLPLQGEKQCDVAIVGGGYTGLWTALRLKQQAPQLHIAILEAYHCGYGASGRNGGQVHSWFAELDILQKLTGKKDALMLARASVQAIDELQQLQESRMIDMDLRLDGWLWTASSHAQEGAWSKAYALCEQSGENPFQLLDAANILQRTGSNISYMGIVEEKAGSLNPAKLVLGLRSLVQRQGVSIHENSPVERIVCGKKLQLHTKKGCLTAKKIVLATNAWLASLPLLRPYFYVVNSQVIATEAIAPLLEQIGWVEGCSICDSQHHVLFYQRTPSGRVIFGRGTGEISYKNRITHRFNRSPDRGRTNLREFHRVYSQLKHAPIYQDWCGAIDCTPQHLPVFDKLDGHPDIFFGAGFNGTGIAQTPVAGHILASLVLGQDNQWSRCGLVGLNRRTKLPPEPWRYLGAKVVRHAITRKNNLEIRNRQPGRLTRFLASLSP